MTVSFFFQDSVLFLNAMAPGPLPQWSILGEQGSLQELKSLNVVQCICSSSSSSSSSSSCFCIKVFLLRAEHKGIRKDSSNLPLQKTIHEYTIINLNKRCKLGDRCTYFICFKAVDRKTTTLGGCIDHCDDLRQPVLDLTYIIKCNLIYVKQVVAGDLPGSNQQQHEA